MSTMEISLRSEYAAKETVESIRAQLYQILRPSPFYKKIVTDWANSGGWQFEDFATFMHLVGIKRIVSYVGFYSDGYSFGCVNNMEKSVQILLDEGDDINCPEIWVIDTIKENYTINENCFFRQKYITNKYIVNRKSKEDDTPQVSSSKKSISISGGNNLDSSFSSTSYFGTLTIGGYTDLKIIIKINAPSFDFLNAKASKNFQLVEDYLLSLEHKHFMLDYVYERVMGLFGFVDESSCKEVLFFYANAQGIQLSTIHKKEGKMHEYAVLEDGKTYDVCVNGDWKYISDNITIVYSKKKDDYVYHVKGEHLPDTLSKKSIKSFWDIKDKITKLMNFAFGS